MNLQYILICALLERRELLAIGLLSVQRIAEARVILAIVVVVS